MGSNPAQTVRIAHDFEREPVACSDTGFPDICLPGFPPHLLSLKGAVLRVSKKKRELLVNAPLDALRQPRIVAVE